MVESTAYVLIRGPSYRGLDFEARERVREGLRDRLASHGVRFLQYDWVWDDEDRCLLLVGTYRNRDDAFWWIHALETMGFDVVVRADLPGEAHPSDAGPPEALVAGTRQGMNS
jgi:hypothetical protein